MTPRTSTLRLCAALLLFPGTALAEQREEVLRQVKVPHGYYWREMYVPQVTGGPTAAAWSPDGQELVYAMGGSLWRQRVGSDQARELTSGPGLDHQPDWSPDGRFVVFASDATNLLGNAVDQPNGTFQIFLRDRCVDGDGLPIPGCTAATTLVSSAPDAGRGTASSSHPALAENGSATAFLSSAANLLGPGVDTNGVADVFVRDR